MQKKQKEKQKPKQIKMTKVDKEKKRRKYKIIKFFIKAIVIIALFIGLIAYGFTSPMFNITEIEVTGNRKFTEEEYISLSGLKIDDNIFNFRKSKVSAAIKENAYVESITIKRKLPTRIEIHVQERKTNYLVELDTEEFAYINNQGYILEISKEKLPLTIITGISTNIEDVKPGNRLDNPDLERLQSVIQIKDAVKNQGITNELSKINVKSRTNYILSFDKEAKEVHLGEVNDELSGRMLYLKFLLDEQEGIPGTIYLNQNQVYFSPK